MACVGLSSEGKISENYKNQFWPSQKCSLGCIWCKRTLRRHETDPKITKTSPGFWDFFLSSTVGSVLDCGWGEVCNICTKVHTPRQGPKPRTLLFRRKQMQIYSQWSRIVPPHIIPKSGPAGWNKRWPCRVFLEAYCTQLRGRRGIAHAFPPSESGPPLPHRSGRFPTLLTWGCVVEGHQDFYRVFVMGRVGRWNGWIVSNSAAELKNSSRKIWTLI